MSVQIDLTSPEGGRSRFSRKWPLIIGIFFVCGLSIAIGVFGYNYGKKDALSETDNVVQNVGMHILLPPGTPRIGKISDTSQFASDPFLSQSRIDDVVLFYPYEGRTVKAILWRPSEKKIVDVSLVTLPDPATVK